jgi:hypothetical protein
VRPAHRAAQQQAQQGQERRGALLHLLQAQACPLPPSRSRPLQPALQAAAAAAARAAAQAALLSLLLQGEEEEEEEAQGAALGSPPRLSPWRRLWRRLRAAAAAWQAALCQHSLLCWLGCSRASLALLQGCRLCSTCCWLALVLALDLAVAPLHLRLRQLQLLLRPPSASSPLEL